MKDYICSFPRAGSNYLCQLFKLAKHPAGSAYLPHKNRRNKQILKSHAWSAESLMIDGYTGGKVIFLVRDPRDQIISAYEFTRRIDPEISQKEFLGLPFSIMMAKSPFARCTLPIAEVYRNHRRLAKEATDTSDAITVSYSDLLNGDGWERCTEYIGCKAHGKKPEGILSKYDTEARPRAVVGGWRLCLAKYQRLIEETENQLHEHIEG